MFASRNCRSFAAGLLGVGVAVSLAVSARAANPQITLKLENVTAGEALQALEKASDLPLEYRESPREQVQRASFDWSGVPLSRAMRDLTEKYRLIFSPRMFREGYFVSRGEAPPVAPSPVVSERNGLRLSVVSVQSASFRDKKLNAEPQQNAGSLVLSLALETPGEDAERLIRVTHLTAKDDLGNILNEGGVPTASAMEAGAYPDRASSLVSLTGYDPRARKLAWLEGEVERYGLLQDSVVSIPLLMVDQTARFEAGTHFEAGHLKLDVLKTEFPEVGGRRGAEMKFKVEVPQSKQPLTPRLAIPILRVALIGASGKRYSPNIHLLSLNFGHPAGPHELDCRWFDVPEKVTAVRVKLVERGDEQPLTTFRLTDIPLPSPDLLAARP